MRGSVGSYTTKGGQRLWRIRYDLPPGPDGRRRPTTRRGFARRKDAEKALTEILGSLERGTYVDPSKVTVRQYLEEEWLPSRKPTQERSGRGHRGKVGIGTWDSYVTYTRSYIVPRLGRIPLQKLSRADLNGLYDWLETEGGRSGKGLSPKTVANVHGIIHKALGDAVKWGKLQRNVADAVEPPKSPKPQTEVWTVDQLRAFLTQVREDRLYALWLLFATTGMRRAEACGLTWADLDLETGTVSVEWTLGVADNKVTWKPEPKSAAGERTLSLDPATVAALKRWRKTQAEERLAAGPAWEARQEDWRGLAREDLVVTWQDGRMVHPERISKAFLRHTEAAGLPRVRLHDLRHTYATAALSSATGWSDVKVISERLGHASIAITLDTYSHVLPQTDAATAETLAKLILGEART